MQKLVFVFLAAVCQDRNGLQLEKIGQFFQVPPKSRRKNAEKRIMVCSSLKKSLDIIFLVF